MKQWLTWLFPNRRRNIYVLTVLAIAAVGVAAAGGGKLIALW